MSAEIDRNPEQEAPPLPHCSLHDGIGRPADEPCTLRDCVFLSEIRLLRDRVSAIDLLAECAREAVLLGSGEAVGMPLSACLEAVRVLARSITEDKDLMFPGQKEAEWVVYRPTRAARAAHRFERAQGANTQG